MFSPIEWFIFPMGIYWIAFALLFVAAGVFDFINFFLFVFRYWCTGAHWRNNAHRQKNGTARLKKKPTRSRGMVLKHAPGLLL